MNWARAVGRAGEIRALQGPEDSYLMLQVPDCFTWTRNHSNSAALVGTPMSRPGE